MLEIARGRVCAPGERDLPGKIKVVWRMNMRACVIGRCETCLGIAKCGASVCCGVVYVVCACVCFFAAYMCATHHPSTTYSNNTHTHSCRCILWQFPGGCEELNQIAGGNCVSKHGGKYPANRYCQVKQVVWRMNMCACVIGKCETCLCRNS